MVQMKDPPGYEIGDGNCLSMLKCIYGLVQDPCQYYMLCREVYQKVGMKQPKTMSVSLLVAFQTSSGNHRSRMRICLSAANVSKWKLCHMQMRVYRSCCDPVAAMILVLYVDNYGIRHKYGDLVQEFETSVK